MTINTTKEQGTVTIAPVGRLDSVTAPQLEEAVDAVLGEAQALRFDFKDLEYISSAGLRVLLKAQNRMNGKGTMTVTGVNEMIQEVFDVTGFSDVLTVE